MTDSITGTTAAWPRSEVDPYSDEFLADPFPFLARLRDAGPVVYLDRYEVFAVARHEQVQAVLKDPRVFSSAAGTGITNFNTEKAWRKPSILLEVDPPVHTHNRKVVARALAPRSLGYLQEVFDRKAAELADSLVARGSFDAVPDLAEIFPTQVFADAFGLQPGGRDQLLAYGALVFNGMGPPNHLFEASMDGAGEVIAWITQQCSRSSLRPDGLGALIYAGVDAGEVTEDEAALLVRSFLSAGLDTTVSALALGVLDFVRFPGQWQALREDPSLARNAFEEVVRIEAPVMNFFRTTTEPVELAGTQPARLREGDGVVRRGQPGPAALGAARPLRHPPQGRRPPGLRHRGAQLRGPGDRAPGGRGRAPGAGGPGQFLAPDRRAASPAQQLPARPRHPAGSRRARVTALRGGLHPPPPDQAAGGRIGQACAARRLREALNGQKQGDNRSYRGQLLLPLTAVGDSRQLPSVVGRDRDGPVRRARKRPPQPFHLVDVGQSGKPGQGGLVV